jgi:transmembrane sensor
MEHKYELYDTAQFLDDPFFIEWVKHQKPEAVAFWNAWIQSNPPNLEAMWEAEAKLRAFLSVQRIDIENEEAGQVWDRIQNTLAHSHLPVEGRSIPSRVRPMYRTWWAAAAILLIVATGSYFLWKQDAGKEVARNHQPPIVNDLAPGDNKAILTLADGTKVVLDTAGNGALTQQGNITVIKLGGKLAYEGSSLNNEPVTEVAYNTITTPKGGQYQLELVDGTRVWLNAASSLRFPTAFSGRERRVELTGEGYFEVAHNPAKPFHVMVGNMAVRVLGTHFNINSYSDEEAITTTLLEGSVQVNRGTFAQKLVPGEQARVDGNKFNIIKKVDLEQVVAWKNGLFNFHGESLESTMRQISRWYDVEVVYEDRIPDIRLSGRMQRNLKLSQIIKGLEDADIHFRIEGRKLIVFP